MIFRMIKECLIVNGPHSAVFTLADATFTEYRNFGAVTGHVLSIGRAANRGQSPAVSLQGMGVSLCAPMQGTSLYL